MQSFARAASAHKYQAISQAPRFTFCLFKTNKQIYLWEIPQVSCWIFSNIIQWILKNFKTQHLHLSTHGPPLFHHIVDWKCKSPLSTCSSQGKLGVCNLLKLVESYVKATSEFFSCVLLNSVLFSCSRPRTVPRKRKMCQQSMYICMWWPWREK